MTESLPEKDHPDSFFSNNKKYNYEIENGIQIGQQLSQELG
jgi:hypothetical protein